MNIHIHHWGDLHLLKRTIESIPRSVHVYVIDGRFCNFKPGEPALTRGTEEYVESKANVSYHAPPEDRLPFGHDLGIPAELRPGVHAKARFTQYKVLPQDEWTLQLDTDERLVMGMGLKFDGLDSSKRYQPEIELSEDREWPHPFIAPRLWVPGEWTVWIDDCAVPREMAHRDTPVKRIRELYMEHREEYHEFVDGIKIRNHGHQERPDDYVEARVEHLREIGREGRADELAEYLRGEQEWHGEGERKLKRG